MTGSMVYRTGIAGILIGVVFFTFCRRDHSNQSDIEIALEEVLSIGELETEDLFMWAGISVDSRKNIFVSDMMDFTVKKFNSQGRLVKKAGGKGQGPGEFTAPLAVDSGNKYFYVLDQYKLGIQVFDLDLNFVKVIRCEWPILDFKVITDEKFAVVPINEELLGHLAFIDNEGKILGKLQYCRQNDVQSMMLDQVNLGLSKNGNIYVAFLYRDCIKCFSPEGNMLWETSLLGGIVPETEMLRGFDVPIKMIYKSICLDSRGRIYILGGADSGNPSRRVFVLDPEGARLTFFDLPEASHLIYLDADDYLYARANEGVTLKKYRLIYQ